MSEMPPVLGYASFQTPGEFAFEERDANARLVFPLAPKWTYVVGIVVPITAGALLMSVPSAVLTILHCRGMPLRYIPIRVLTAWRLLALCFAMVGIFNAIQYRRWGRVPRVLAADKSGLTFSRLGLRQMRYRHWDVEGISAVKVQPLRGPLLSGRPAAMLIVEFRSGRDRSFFLSTNDRTLPIRAAERFAAILKCPLVKADPR